MTVKSTGSIPTQGDEFNLFLRSGVDLKRGVAAAAATQHAMPQEFGGKRGTECLNTSFPLSTLLCAGYSVKMIF